MRQVKVIVEKHSDGYVAYPLGVKGVIVGEGDTYEEALADVKSAIKFHIESFGEEVLEVDPPVLEAFVAEAGVDVYWPNSQLMRQSRTSSERSSPWAFVSSERRNISRWFVKIPTGPRRR